MKKERNEIFTSAKLFVILNGYPCVVVFKRDESCGTCCIFCKDLPKCLWKWKTDYLYCTKLKESRWCSATRDLVRRIRNETK